MGILNFSQYVHFIRFC